MMDGRDAFLTLAREKHLEFSSLRRCKYSTLALIYELHTQVIILCTMFKPYVYDVQHVPKILSYVDLFWISFIELKWIDCKLS